MRELEKYQTPIFLRPKRFGKSLWVSMLEHYYDVRFKDQFEEFFGKTEIGRSFTTKLRGDAEVVIVEVAGNRGYNWHTLQA